MTLRGKKKLIIIGLVFTVLFMCISGCTGKNNQMVKEGKVMKIEYDNAFGGTFTDWYDALYFEDGSIVWVQEREQDLSSIRLNTTGKFYFEKNYFTYNKGVEYKLHKFEGAIYYDNPMYKYVEVKG